MKTLVKHFGLVVGP